MPRMKVAIGAKLKASLPQTGWFVIITPAIDR
jgi:hypothetical protein